jgi:hypothetical protein
MDSVGIKEDTLGQGGLAGVDVRTDPDIADLAQVARHGLAPQMNREGAAGGCRSA